MHRHVEPARTPLTLPGREANRPDLLTARLLERDPSKSLGSFWEGRLGAYRLSKLERTAVCANSRKRKRLELSIISALN